MVRGHIVTFPTQSALSDRKVCSCGRVFTFQRVCDLLLDLLPKVIGLQLCKINLVVLNGELNRGCALNIIGTNPDTVGIFVQQVEFCRIPTVAIGLCQRKTALYLTFGLYAICPLVGRQRAGDEQTGILVDSLIIIYIAIVSKYIIILESQDALLYRYGGCFVVLNNLSSRKSSIIDANIIDARYATRIADGNILGLHKSCVIGVGERVRKLAVNVYIHTLTRELLTIYFITHGSFRFDNEAEPYSATILDVCCSNAFFIFYKPCFI